MVAPFSSKFAEKYINLRIVDCIGFVELAVSPACKKMG
jgi:hypothetical protein